MAKILFYYPSNKRSISIETLIRAIHARGIGIEFLTTCERGPLHDALASLGVPVHAHPISRSPSFLYYVRQMLFLARFCRRVGVTHVFSNLQHANFIAVFAQYLMSATVIVFRHHFKFVLPGDGVPLEVNATERVFDRVINRLAHRIVVPSTGVAAGMTRHEAVEEAKLSVIPYVYDFDRYGRPDPDAVAEIRSRHPARLRLLMASRLIPFKRPQLVFSAVHALLKEGLDLVLFVLDDGPEREFLNAFVRENDLQANIIMLGHREDFLEYMAASDLLVHPSLTEASSNVVKELALVGRPSLVCEGVGDFDSYLVDGVSALIVPRALDTRELAKVIADVYHEPTKLSRMGDAARAAVLSRFQVSEAALRPYLLLVSEQGSTGPESSEGRPEEPQP